MVLNILETFTFTLVCLRRFFFFFFFFFTNINVEYLSTNITHHTVSLLYVHVPMYCMKYVKLCRTSSVNEQYLF